MEKTPNQTPNQTLAQMILAWSRMAPGKLYNGLTDFDYLAQKVVPLASDIASLDLRKCLEPCPNCYTTLGNIRRVPEDKTDS